MKTTHKVTLASLAAAGVLGTAAVAASPVAEAHVPGGGHARGERFEQMLANKAEFLGLTVDELKEELQTKTLRQIAEEQGITREDIIAHKRARLEEHWRNQGVSEEDIARRLERFDERTADGLPERGERRRGFRGFGNRGA